MRQRHRKGTYVSDGNIYMTGFVAVPLLMMDWRVYVCRDHKNLDGVRMFLSIELVRSCDIANVGKRQSNL